MNPQIEKTGLWSSSLGHKETDPELVQKIERLRAALTRFRENIAVIVSRISGTFPELTVHDITHLDALWETADLIAGNGYPLNPMEAFVFGGAILLHDAAHCFEAYEGGQIGVRETIVWKDAYAYELAVNPNNAQENLKHQADFTAIRLLHAQQAEVLGEREWRSENGSQSFFLIEDSNLRVNYGRLIGRLAASHNWDIDEIPTKLRGQFNATGAWPSEWRVDPVKLACLLRCADAAHIDDRRAPDFLLALIKRSGVSLDHWKAQNWLSRIDKDLSDPHSCSLLVTSNHAFPPDDAQAWWVAYDAIGLLDKEIQASNNLLISRSQGTSTSPPFKMQRVHGANAPVELSKVVETDGWVPTSARIHVGNIERLVANLGGENLYGGQDKFAVVMRELLQNARDAVAARRVVDRGFSGHILVKLSRESDNTTILEVLDDGTGMSERTITGSLLDFGTSFWASELVRAEFPGLVSSHFKPVGKFGIGFYSVFMVSADVTVASRRFDAGSSDVTRLRFPYGISLRPVLSKGADARYDQKFSTTVRLTLNEALDDVLSQRLNKLDDNSGMKIDVANYIATIAVGLNVDVFLEINGDSIALIHKNIENVVSEEDVVDWITRITLIEDLQLNVATQAFDYVKKTAARMRKIEYDGNTVGLAALLDIPHTSFQFLTTDSVGGLTSNIGRGATGYLGYMDNLPATAKRDGIIKTAPLEMLQSWADDQIDLLKQEGSDRLRLYWAASHMSNMQLDPIDILSFPIYFSKEKYSLLSFDELFEILTKTPIACVMIRDIYLIDVNTEPVVINEYPMLRPLTHGNFLQIQLRDGRPTYPSSLIGCLDRLVARKGRTLTYEVQAIPLATIAGSTSMMLISMEET